MEKRYWIGDPCYIVPDEDWNIFCSETEWDSGGEYVSYHGQRIHFHSAGGDGSWSFNCGKFCVDSGIFAFIDLSLMPSHYNKEGLSDGILFDEEPTLETEGYTVIINGEKDWDGQLQDCDWCGETDEWCEC